MRVNVPTKEAAQDEGGDEEEQPSTSARVVKGHTTAPKAIVEEPVVNDEPLATKRTKAKKTSIAHSK